MPQANQVKASVGATGTDGPIPITVVTGFPVAGKTTRLKRRLADLARSDVTVVVNEQGRVGVDPNVWLCGFAREQVHGEARFVAEPSEIVERVARIHRVAGLAFVAAAGIAESARVRCIVDALR